MFKLLIGFDLVWKILFTYVADIDALDIIDTRGTVSCLNLYSSLGRNLRKEVR